MSKQDLIIAVSGGVDSSVTAALLNNSNKYNCYGATMSVWNSNGEKTKTNIKDAGKVCHDLGIPFYVAQLEEIFTRDIINDYFIGEYICGRTPNPCVKCNNKIKFGRFYEMTSEHFRINNSMFATGHYVRIKHEKGRGYLYKGTDVTKDQSYMLWMLNQDQLKRTITPLGDFTKKEIREMARDLGLHVSEKKDSQDACFLDGSYKDFIEKHHKDGIKTGNFVDMNGNFIGKHQGIAFYTIGQRKGLGIASDRPYYVKSINPDTNDVIVCRIEELNNKKFYISNVNWIAFDQLTDKLECKVRIRYNSKEVDATVYPMENHKSLVEFKEAQSAVTPGQSAVFYDGDMIIGGGIIDDTEE